MDLSIFDTALLSRIQFAVSITFHIIFPTLNIGLGLFLVIMESLWLKTKNPIYYTICRFWTKIFALTFGMGVVSGLVLSYQIGTNFPGLTDVAGGVLGALFAYEVLTAFFLEAGFLGIMLFGWQRVHPNLHLASTFLVFFGTVVSAFWIMSANSWMQYPTGYSLSADGQYIAENWFEVIFNPTVIPRYFHMMMASLVTTVFFIAGVAAWHIRKNIELELSRKTLKFCIIAALILTPIQIGIGDWVGIKVYQNQPIKTAAIEGLWETQKGAPLLLFGWPDQENEITHYEIGIPKLASLINTHSWEGEMMGLKEAPKEDRPPVWITFWTFRVMVGLGMLFLGLGLLGTYFIFRKTLENHTWYLKVLTLSAPLGFIATIAGWFTAEIGRQPWVVYGLLRTNDMVAIVPSYKVAFSLLVLSLVYFIIFAAYLFYLFYTIRKGPNQEEHAHVIFGYMPVDEQIEEEMIEQMR